MEIPLNLNYANMIYNTTERCQNNIANNKVPIIYTSFERDLFIVQLLQQLTHPNKMRKYHQTENMSGVLMVINADSKSI